jgi:hypothetical protein
MMNSRKNYPDVYSRSFESEKEEKKLLCSQPVEIENEGKKCNQQQLFFISHSSLPAEMETTMDGKQWQSRKYRIDCVPH